MKALNIIFLDCDGVINNDDFIAKWKKENGNSRESLERFRNQYYFHNGESGYVVPELLARLLALCNNTDCKIVWSSSWRESYFEKNTDTGDFYFNYHKIKRLWNAKGLPFERLIGCTPCEDLSRYSYVPRGVEIQQWIDDNRKVYNIGKCAILDDNEDAWVGVKYKQARFFQTTFEHGLTQEIAQQIIKWFSEVDK